MKKQILNTLVMSFIMSAALPYGSALAQIGLEEPNVNRLLVKIDPKNAEIKKCLEGSTDDCKIALVAMSDEIYIGKGIEAAAEKSMIAYYKNLSDANEQMVNPTSASNESMLKNMKLTDSQKDNYRNRARLMKDMANKLTAIDLLIKLRTEGSDEQKKSAVSLISGMYPELKAIADQDKAAFYPKE